MTGEPVADPAAPAGLSEVLVAYSRLRHWRPVADLAPAEAGALFDHAAICAGAREAGIDLQVIPLPFYKGTVCLVRLEPPGAAGLAAGFGLWSRHGLFPLDGSSAPIHDATAREGFAPTGSNVLAYVVFFCRHVLGDEGPFWVLLHADDLNADGPPPGPDSGPPAARPPASCILPPRLERSADGAGWVATVSVQYGSAIFKATFQVAPDGDIQMADGDEVLTAGVPFNPARNAPPLVWTCDGAAIEFPGRGPVRPRHPNRRAVSRSVGEAMVRLQLLQSLRAGDAAPLFDPGGRDGDELVGEFARFVLGSAVLVVVESRMDYVERLVGDLLIGALHKPVSVTRSRFTTDGPDQPGVLLPPVADGELVEISLHESGYVRRAQAVAFTLGSTDAAALVGCRGIADLPAPLRQIVDVTVTLRPLHPEAFRELFREVFDCDLPEGAGPGAAEWLRYLEPADLERALRDRAFREAAGGAEADAGWRPDDALEAIETRVRERLARFLPAEGRRLADLVGLGAARQVVQDLMADFAAALAGRVDWKEVDRGMLLVGPPGTGKTMLARVLARECGVRFVSARIGGWMTGDSNLGTVIANMRQTFSDARQYAPCILFLDEIDSLGNRQEFGDHNASWDVAFLTAVLAELQGFDELQGVFVIGATNHENQVDPALRRAGRLDQVVRLDYPPVTDLAHILEQYLQPYRAAGRLAADIDVQALGAVMAGASGADVEQYVRDAARRARRDGQPIAARHLVASATGVPRRPVASAAHSPAEQERTAFHEAGHAVAQLTTGAGASTISVVSIVERSDGSLGFTGFVPDDAIAWSARQYREHLEVILAGRAAEELRYGPARVSGGAGGPDESCDLAMATRTAARMVCEAGLGSPRRLMWQAGPTGSRDIEEMQALLQDSYGASIERLRRHWPLVEALAARLVADRQVLGPEISALARSFGVGP